MLIRSSANPILSAHPDLPWLSKKLYNCAVYKDGKTYIMLFRAIGDDWVSRLGIAHSEDGEHFVIKESPVFSPVEPWEHKGCEDPRMVKLGDTYYITYTAYDGSTARAAIASSKDLKTWVGRRLLFPDLNHQHRELPLDWSKAAAIYPEKVNGKYRLLFGDDKIWAASSDDLVNWQAEDAVTLAPRGGHFDSNYIEMGPPPIKTDRGWLILYHGIEGAGDKRVYRLGAALIDAEDPHKVLWRCAGPILSPEEPYEALGLIDIINGGFKRLKTLGKRGLQKLAKANMLPKAVFCCGAVLEGDKVRLYYSGSDTVICMATIDLATIFSS